MISQAVRSFAIAWLHDINDTDALPLQGMFVLALFNTVPNIQYNILSA